MPALATRGKGQAVSDTDSFIDEVTDEVRRDRLFATLRRHGWIGITAVLLIVGGAAWFEWHKARARAEAEAFGDAVIAAVGQKDAAARIAALDALPAAGNRTELAAFIAAGEALAAGDGDDARARLQAVAGDAAIDPAYRQLAELKALIIAGAGMPAADRDAVLDRLAVAGQPLRPLAMEQQALARLDAGDDEGALALARQILAEPEVMQGLRRRVSQLIILLGGDPAAV